MEDSLPTLLRGIADFFYPVGAFAQEPEATDSVSPTPSDTIAPTPSDAVVPTPSDKVATTTSPTVEIILPNVDGEIPTRSVTNNNQQITNNGTLLPSPVIRDSSSVISSARPTPSRLPPRIYYTYDLPEGFTADDLEVLKARVDALATVNASVEVYLDSVILEVEFEETAPGSGAVEPGSGKGPGGGTIIAERPEPDLTFHDHSGDPRSDFQFIVSHDRFKVEALEKRPFEPHRGVRPRIGYRIEDSATQKWLKFELLDDSATTVNAGVFNQKFIALARRSSGEGGRGPGLTVEYESLKDRVKALYVLKQKPTSPVLSFRLTHNFRATDDNGNTFFASSFTEASVDKQDLVFYGDDGTEIFRLPVPQIWDAADNQATGNLQYDPASGLLTLTVPPQFLESATYPVTVDPTTIVGTVATDSTFHSGGRKLVVDRYGNLIAFARRATNTLTPYYSNNGGKTWTAASDISTAVETEGFGVAYDGSTSTIHVSYNTTGSVLRYNQVNIGYDANSDITGLTLNDVGLTTGDNVETNIIIAASGTNSYVPIIFYERDTLGGTKASGLYYSQCNPSGDVANCRSSGNWTAEAAICNTGERNVSGNSVVGLTAAQSFPSKKVWVFTNAITNAGCGVLVANALNYALGTEDTADTWTFPTQLVTIDGNISHSIAGHGTSTLNDTAWSTTQTRVLVNYFRLVGSTYETVSRFFYDDNTASSTVKVISSDTAYTNVAGQAQCTIDTTPTATTSKRFVCFLQDQDNAADNDVISIASIPLDWSGSWTFTTILDPALTNSFPMVKTSYVDAYHPWRAAGSTTSYTAVKDSATSTLGYAKLDVVYTQGTTLLHHTWHLHETLFVTSASALSATGTNPVAVTFADENNYASVTSSDDIRLSITTSGADFPGFTLRRRNMNGNDTDDIGVFWEGQTSNTATGVRLQIFKFRGVGGEGWKELDLVDQGVADAEFTVSATATNDFPVSGASVSDYYGTDPTGGLTGGNIVIVRVYQGAAASETLRTDRLCAFCSGTPITPQAPLDQTLDKKADEPGQSITDTDAQSTHLQTDANDISGATNNLTESNYNARDGTTEDITTSNATSYNVFLYRAREPNSDNTSMFTVEWVGQSSTTQHPVVLQVHKFTGSATGWRTIAAVTPPAADSIFSVSGTVFAPTGNANYQMDDFYDSDPSGDISGNSVIAVRIFQQTASTSGFSVTLKTDMVTSTFGFIGLTQSSFGFFNDNGDDPDNNTVTGTVDTALAGARVGERFNLRVQLTATTTVGLSQIPLVGKNFRLQYTATSSPAIACENHGEGSWQFIGDADDPTSIASISPTSINVSRALSGYHGERLQSRLTANQASLTFREGLFVADHDAIVATSVLATSVDRFAIQPDNYTELSYAIHTGDAQPGSTFCFRLVMDDLGPPGVNLKNPGTATTITFTTYTQYPKLSVVSSANDTLRYSKGVAENKTDAATDLVDTISSFWSTNIGRALTYDSFTHTVYLFGNSGKFATYDPATDTATDLTSKISSFWLTDIGYALTYDTFTHTVYLSGVSGKFAKYDPATDTATDLTSKISSFWSTSTGRALAYDAFAHTVYLFGTGGKFATYDPATDTATDLTSKISSFWGADAGLALTYDSFTHTVYLFGGSGKFATYDPATDTATDLISKISSFWSTTTGWALTYDAFAHTVYLFGGDGGKFATYDPATDTATDLTSKISSFWGGGVGNALTYDAFSHTVYLFGDFGQFATYDPASDTATDLTSKISSFWVITDGNTLTYDAFTHTVYLFGSSGKFAKYDPDSSTPSLSAERPAFRSIHDTTMFLDATGYSFVATDDDLYDTVTSAAATGFTTSFPALVFKVKNTGSTPLSDPIVLSWNGFTSAANSQTASTVIGIFNLSTSSWEVLAGDTSAGADTEFTLSPANITANQADYYDTVTTIYVRVLKNNPADGAVGLATDQFLATFAPLASTLTQNDYRWYENVDSATPTTALAAENTEATITSTASPVRLRMNISDTDAELATSSQAFKIQYSQATSTGWVDVGATGSSTSTASTSPSSLFSDGSGAVSWTNPGNATSSNNVYAVASLSDFDTSDYLRATSFGFSVPAGATIDGIMVEVERSASIVATVQDASVLIIKGGVLSGSDRASAAAWPTTDAIQTYGDPTEKWGLSWTASDINAGDLGVGIAAEVPGAASPNANIDHIRIKVFYTPISAVWQFQDNASVSDGVTVSSTLLASSDVTETYEEENPTATNTRAIPVGQEGEWDFALDPQSATSTTYYFRMVTDGGTALDSYTRYPTITIGAAEPVLTQRAAIFENDDGNTVDTNSLTASGSPALTVEKGQRFTVRFQVDNAGSATTSAFSVQYDRNDGTWNTATSGEISLQFGISGSNGDALTVGPKANSGSCDGGASYVNGSWHENATTTGQFTLGQNECTEFGFTFSTATATVGATYNFRLVSATSLAPFNSVATPTITIVATQDRIHSKNGSGSESASLPTDADDLTYYLDATGYAAVVSNDSVYDSATSTGSNIPISIFKIRNTNDNNTDFITITWDGQSNVAPSTASVTSWIWSNALSTWITVSSNNFTAPDTDFQFQTTTSGSQFYDANNIVYFRVAQAAGAEALRTDLISMSFAPPSEALTQRAAIFENDNGPDVNSNTLTASGSPALTVERGQRLALRFQVDNTGTGSTTTQFHVQFDRSDGAWGTVTSGEISASLGLAGQDGDALTSIKAGGGSCDGGASYVNGSWHENTATSAGVALGIDKCTEFAFMLNTASSVAGTTYTFRLVSATSLAPFNSVATPTITIVNPAEIRHSKGAFHALDGFRLPTDYATSDEDLEYYLDATGYSAIAQDDSIYDAATSTATSVNYGSATSATVRTAFVFKMVNPNGNTTDKVNFSWNGQSTTTALPLAFQVYKYGQAGSSATGWITVTTVTPAAADTDFWVTSSIFSANMADYYDPANTNRMSFRVMQAHNTVGYNTPFALRTDIATTTFASLTLTQQGFLFENDDGSTADENTTTGTVNAALQGVRRGERLNLRLSVSSVSSLQIYEKVYQLQYHATSTPAATLNCSTAVEASWVTVGVGDDPSGATSVSPTSVNFSLADSFTTDDAITVNKLTSGGNFQNGVATENDARTSRYTFPANNGTELVYAIQTGEMQVDSRACFRLVMEENADQKQGNIQPFDAYTQYPVIDVLSVADNTQRFSKGVQKVSDDRFLDLSSKVTYGSNTRGLTYDTSRRLVFLGAQSAAKFAQYDPATDTYSDLSGNIPSSFGGASPLVYDSFRRVIYMGAVGTANALGRYDPADGTFTDLTSRLEAASFGTDLKSDGLTYDSFNRTIYVGGNATNTFGRYDPAIDVFTNLTSRVSLGSNPFSLEYDSFNHTIYLGGDTTGDFGRYDPTTESFTDLSSLVTYGGNATNLAYDSLNHQVYMVADNASNALGKYDPATNTFTNLTSRVTLGGTLTAIAYDAFNHALYLGNNVDLGRYDPTGDTFTDLSTKISAFASLRTLLFDPFDHTIYMGSFAANTFARFDPSLSSNHDNLLFFDEYDYAGTATTDNIWASVTSIPSGSSSSYATFLFKLKNPGDNSSGPDEFTVQWEGQSSTSATSILLQVFDFDVQEGAATSTTGWKTIATATAASFTVDNNLTLTARVDGDYPVASATVTRYFTRHQNGVDPTATTTVMLRLIQQSSATSAGPLTLRTDTICATFGPGTPCITGEAAPSVTTLTQNRFRFYVNTDSATTTDPWPLGGSDLVEDEWIGSTGSPPITGTSVRIRVNIDVSGANLAASATSFRLQVAKVGVAGFAGGGTASSCAAVLAADWQNIGDSASTTAAWRGYDNAGAADDAEISSTNLLLSDTDVAGTYEETLDTSSSTPANPNAVNAGQQVEYDFVVQNNRAAGGGEYCFRVVQSDNGTPYPLNGGYSVYPRIHVAEELTFTIDNNSVNFEALDNSNTFTAATSVTTTVSTNAGSGYVIRTWSTQPMTHVNLSQYTIVDWTGTNGTPVAWTGDCISNSECGFGYSTDDATLTGGTADRFTSPKSYAGFVHDVTSSNGDPVADETGPVQNSQHQVDLRISVDRGQAAGVYQTTVIFIATPTF